MLIADVPLVGVRLLEDGTLAPDNRTHGISVVATQDCDLVRFDEYALEDVVELRPVFDHDPPAVQGIRSQRCMLIGSRYVEAQSRRIMISPAALTALAVSGRGRRDDSVADSFERKAAFKTWLGLRYDRPAVPQEWVPLAERIATEIRRKGKSYSDKVRDVLAQIEPGHPPTFHLHAVVLDENDRDDVTEWLTETTIKVPRDLGILAAIDVRTARETSLHLIETSFAVDLTQITWGGTPLRGEPGRLSQPMGPSS